MTHFYKRQYIQQLLVLRPFDPNHLICSKYTLGRIEGKRARGRQGGTLLGWLERATGFRPLDLIKMMRERREEEAVTAAYAKVLARHTD